MVLQARFGAPAPAAGMKKSAVWTFSAAHLMNDMMTVGIVPALLPLYKAHFHLTYTQTGLIVLLSYLTSSVMQPLFGWFTDRRPHAWLLPFGVTLSCAGLAATAFAPSFGWLLLFVTLSGLGSGAFHPEASRGTYLASGNARGLAQAIFQVGGNAGQALGPLAVSLFIIGTGLRGLAAFFLLALAACLATARLLPWYRSRIQEEQKKERQLAGENRATAMVLFILVIVFRSWCQIGVAGFLPFFYDQHHIAIRVGEWFSFLFLAAGAVGTFLGGALSDKLGRKWLLVASLALSIPFAALLPWTARMPAWLAAVVLMAFGFTVLSSFAVTVVYAQLLLPRNIAMASGLTIGFGVGAGGIGATYFGRISDVYGIGVVFDLIVLLPLLGALCSLFLPSDRTLAAR